MIRKFKEQFPLCCEDFNGDQSALKNFHEKIDGIVSRRAGPDAIGFMEYVTSEELKPFLQ